MATSCEDLVALIDSFFKTEDSITASILANDIVQKKYTLLQLVEKLGSHLTSSHVTERATAFKLMSATLCCLPPSLLSSEEVLVLSRFLCERFKDHHSITHHVLQASAALVKSDGISRDCIQMLLLAISEDVYLQSLPQDERQHFYQMIIYLLTNRLGDLQALGQDFVCRFIHLMDGEKDPRNLLLAFNCVTFIAKELPLGTFKEELFEVVACYFPVDFNPVSGDPHSITKDQLVAALRASLASTEQFAEFCLPMLLEKFTSTSLYAKAEVLRTLIECAPVYGEKLLLFTDTFYACLRREVFSSSQESLAELCLETLTVLTQVISKLPSTSTNSPLQTLTNNICHDLESHLSEVEVHLVVPSGRLIRAMAAGSSSACSLTCAHILPILLRNINKHIETTARKVLWQEVSEMLHLLENWLDTESNPVWRQKETLYRMIQETISGEVISLRLAVIRCIMSLCSMPGILGNTECEELAQSLLNCTHDINLRSEAILALSNLMSQMSTHYVETIFSRLSDRTDVEDVSRWQIMSGLCTSLTMTRLVVPHFLNQLEICNNDVVDTLDNRVRKATILCQLLHEVISNNATSGDRVQYLSDAIILPVLHLCVTSALGPVSVLTQPAVIHRLAASVRQIVLHLPDRERQIIMSNVISIFYKADLSSLGNSVNTIDLSLWKPFQEDCQPVVSQLLAVFNAVVCSQPEGVDVPFCDEIILRLIDVAQSWQHADSVTSAAKCIAGLVNKQAIIPEACRELFTTPFTECKNLDGRIVLLAWLTKALLMRNHPDQKAALHALLGLLADEAVSDSIVQAVKVLIEDAEDVLTPEMYAVILFLHKQRLFILAIDMLVTGFKDAAEDGRCPYLICLSMLLATAPLQVTCQYITKVLPLLIQGLQSDQEELLQDNLTALKRFLESFPETMTAYLSDMMQPLLKIIQHARKMMVRIRALECLESMCSLSEQDLISHQVTVIRTLLSVLDDHKRLVRQAAANTREKWILIGNPAT